MVTLLLFSLSNLNGSIVSFIVDSCTASNLNGLFIILIKKALFLPSSGENMLSEDTKLARKDVLPVSYALLLAQLEQSLSKASLGQMGPEEQLDMILTWRNAYIADTAKMLVQLMQLWKDLITRTQQ